MIFISKDDSDTSIRIRKRIKRQLDKLDFVEKNMSYNDIILELIRRIKKRKRKKR